MRYNSNHEYFTPEIDEVNQNTNQKSLVAAGATNLYTVGKQQMLRIIPAADLYIKFSNDPAVLIADNTNILLKANQEYFVSSGDSKFMTASATTMNIIKVLG